MFIEETVNGSVIHMNREELDKVVKYLQEKERTMTKDTNMLPEVNAEDATLIAPEGELAPITATKEGVVLPHEENEVIYVQKLDEVTEPVA